MVSITYHINRIKRKIYIIIFIKAEEEFGKIQYQYMIKKKKASQKTRNTSGLPQLDKAHIYRKPRANILNGDKLNVFSLRLETRQELLIALEVLANTIRNWIYTNWEGRNKTVFVLRWYDSLCRKSQRINNKNNKKLLELIKNFIASFQDTI